MESVIIVEPLTIATADKDTVQLIQFSAVGYSSV